MWRTGYTEEVAKDKMIRGLNKELGAAWAQVVNKPTGLGQQMALLRDMGHSMEQYKYISSEKGEDQRRPQIRGGEASHNKKRSREKISKERKDQAVELKGIPADIIEERKAAKTCLKCGKGTHKWYDCWAHTPATKRVAATKRGIPQVKDTSKEKRKEEVKISAAGPAEEGRIIELVTDEEGDFCLLRN